MKYVNENGRSMVEMLGVLAIIGVLSVGGIAGYSKAMNKFKINKTTDQISMLVANIRTIYSTQGNYAGLTNETARKFGVVPNDMYGASDADLKNAFGGVVTIASAEARSGTADEAFTIVYEGLSQEACVTLATGDWGSGQSSGLLGVAAGNSSANVTTPLASMFTTGYGTGAGAGGQTGGQTGQSAPFAGETTTTAGCKSCSAGQAYAIPGGSSSVDATPMPVVAAVTACSEPGTANVVGWKYY